MLRRLKEIDNKKALLEEFKKDKSKAWAKSIQDRIDLLQSMTDDDYEAEMLKHADVVGPASEAADGTRKEVYG